MCSLQIPNHVHSIVDPDGAILLDIEGGKYFSLNGIGARIWKSVEVGLTPQEIQAQLSTSYSVPAEQVGRDMAEFIERLKEERLISETT